MATSHRTSEHDAVALESGRLAVGPMPRDMVHGVNSELLDVLTLLIAASGQVDETNGPPIVDDHVTSASSRAVALIGMANDKVRSMLRTISPYV